MTTWITTSLFLLPLSDLRLRAGETRQLLEKNSRTDSLTALLNRHGAQIYMLPIFSRCQQERLSAAGMMVDVDHFKIYNDVPGHQTGDECLRTIRKVLGSFAEEYGLTVTRYGGEEFFLLLPDISFREAQKLSDELLLRIRRKAIPGPLGIVTVSIGTAVCRSGPDNTLSDLFRCADEAIYRAKAGGRDRAVVIEVTPETDENKSSYSASV